MGRVKTAQGIVGAWFAWLLVAGTPDVRPATPPAGFEDHVVVDTTAAGATTPVGIAYEPGSGALFVIEQGDGTAAGSARVRRRDPSTGVVTTALTISCVDSVAERGLLGIAFDPDYLVAGNRYVYLYYTREDVDAPSPCNIVGLLHGGYNQVVRYTESGGTLSGEQVLLRGPQLGANNHEGGTVRFAPDKTLYISMGDNDTDAAPLPASRDLTDLRGKILRINRDGTIPASNPFVGQSPIRPEIYGWGLRNPFRISIDSATGNLFIADVGEATWEEIDSGIPGADYGWPCFEATSPFRTCTPPPTADIKPIYQYGHNGQTPPVEGDAIIGGPIYHATSFPPEYWGHYFFGDYGGGWIRQATIDGSGALTDVTMFLPDATGVTDMAVSPAGCLTWVGITGAGVHDTCYAGGNNGQPQARATAAPMSGLAPLQVQFDGTGSTDPDQDLLTYSWAFGDNTTSASPAPLKTYSTTGVRQAILTVNDGTGTPNASDSAPPLRIVVGNRSPVGTISQPVNGTHYNCGDTITYAGSGTDPEDGTLAAPAFSWTIVFHHTDHTHPFLGPITGVTGGTFTIPNSGEDSTQVFYRVTLDVTDSGAPLGAVGKITQESYVDLLPNVSSVTAAASPAGAGIQLAIDHVQADAPTSKDTVSGYPRTVTAPSPQTVRGATWAFSSWSDAGAAEHTVVPSPTPLTVTASYACTAGCNFSPYLYVSRIAPDTSHLVWSSLPCALSYDAIRGNLTTLRATNGDFSLATAACVGDKLTATTVDDPKVTSPSGFFFLVRANGCGASSYDEAPGSFQPTSRDAEIAASGRDCP